MGALFNLEPVILKELTMADLKDVVRINIKELEEIVSKAVDSGFEKHRTSFYIEPEDHYKAHERLDHFFKLLDEAGVTVRRVLIGACALFLVGCMAAGFITKFWDQ